MPQEPYTLPTTLVVLTALFCLFAFFYWIYPMLCEDYRETHPKANKPTKAEIANRNEIDRLLMPEELDDYMMEVRSKIIYLDETENAIS
jgi:hypothetical protein